MIVNFLFKIPASSIVNEDGSKRHPTKIQIWGSWNYWLMPTEMIYDRESDEWKADWKELSVKDGSLQYKFLLDEMEWYLGANDSKIQDSDVVPHSRLPVSQTDIFFDADEKVNRIHVDVTLKVAVKLDLRDDVANAGNPMTPKKAKPYRPTLPVHRSVSTRAHMAASSRKTRFMSDYSGELKNLVHYHVTYSDTEEIVVYTLSRLTFQESGLPSTFEGAQVRFVYDDTCPCYDRSIPEWNTAVLGSCRPMDDEQRGMVSSSDILEQFKQTHLKSLPNQGAWLLGMVNRVGKSNAIREAGVIIVVCDDWEEAARVAKLLPDEYHGRPIYKLRDKLEPLSGNKDIPIRDFSKLYQGVNWGGSKGRGMTTGPILRSSENRLFMILCGHAVNEGEDVYSPAPANWYLLVDNIEISESNDPSLLTLKRKLKDAIKSLVDVTWVNFANEVYTDMMPAKPVPELSIGRVLYRSQTTDIDWALVELNDNAKSKLPDPVNSFPPVASITRLKKLPRSITQVTRPIVPHNFKKDIENLHKFGWVSDFTTGNVFPDLERNRGTKTLQVKAIRLKHTNMEPTSTNTFTKGGDSSASVFHIVPDNSSSSGGTMVTSQVPLEQHQPDVLQTYPVKSDAGPVYTAKGKGKGKKGTKGRKSGSSSTPTGGKNVSSAGESTSLDPQDVATDDDPSVEEEAIASDMTSMNLVSLLEGVSSRSEKLTIPKTTTGKAAITDDSVVLMTGSLVGICSELWVKLNVSYVERLDNILEAINERDVSLDLDLA